VDLAGLVIRMANENPGWGYTRIRDGLHHLGHEIGRSTVKRILLEHGIEPAPERSRTASWVSFLAAHWGAIAAADFLTVEVLTMGGLVRHQVLVVMDLMTRRVEIAGIICELFLQKARFCAGSGSAGCCGSTTARLRDVASVSGRGWRANWNCLKGQGRAWRSAAVGFD
jgi:hypothetical protein